MLSTRLGLVSRVVEVSSLLQKPDSKALKKTLSTLTSTNSGNTLLVLITSEPRISAVPRLLQDVLTYCKAAGVVSQN
jgi:hypothetical protein